MTAEIAIMNKSAIALAADSAVTFNSPKGQKIKNSVNKLFTLSRYAPIGIMIYGNGELMGVPWESTIKIYRKVLGSRTYTTLQEYAEHFINFLDKGNELFSKEEQLAYFIGCVSGYFQLMKEEIDEQVKALIKKRGKVTNEEVNSIAGDVIRRHAELIDKVPMLPTMSAEDAQSICEIHRKHIHEIMDRVFEKIPITEARLVQIESIIAGLFVRDKFLTSSSGVVVAGFGEKETFPAVALYSVEGVVNNRLKHKLISVNKIDAQHNAWIMPFAQSEMVATFMEGIDPGLRKLFQGFMVEVLLKYPDSVTDRINGLSKEEKKDLKEKLGKECSQILDDFKKKIDEYRNVQHVRPIINVVSMLPKDELAAMAESLVNLTSFKRKVSMDAETVGGPIDVAVISKGDGFVWIKRKHYFEAQLNHHFFANYFHDDRNIAKEEKL